MMHIVRLLPGVTDLGARIFNLMLMHRLTDDLAKEANYEHRT
ncbi:Uncharacterised protein [Serratia fonticola]|nr:Uncharacterised protein [Serratia fonticola]